MQNGAREKREMIDRLEQLRTAVRTADLPPSLRADLELDIAEVERDILVPLPTAAGPLRQALLVWGPRLRDAGQPALAAVVDDAVADLERMGLC